MAFMSPAQYLLQSRFSAYQFTLLIELREYLGHVGGLSGLIRHNLSNHLAMPGNGYGFALLDVVEEAEQMGLGFGGLNLAHFISTSRFDQLNLGSRNRCVKARAADSACRRSFIFVVDA
jgi:hypothetical protein